MDGIADYRFVEALGAGNYGTFYKAEAPPRLALDARFVAVKVLDRGASDAEFRRLATELRIFSSVPSDHLVTMHDAGYSEGLLYYASAYYPEGSLDAATGDGRSDTRLAMLAVADAARGAHALHEVGIVHRDIKPANILLDAGRGRLADLGLARVLVPGMTTAGQGPVGSLPFMSPELIGGGRPGRATDLFSLGATLHQVVSGAGVFDPIPDGSVLEAFTHVLHTAPAVSPNVPEELIPIVAQCVAPPDEPRYPTAAALADALDEILGDER